MKRPTADTLDRRAADLTTDAAELAGAARDVVARARADLAEAEHMARRAQALSEAAQHRRQVDEVSQGSAEAAEKRLADVQQRHAKIATDIAAAEERAAVAETELQTATDAADWDAATAAQAVLLTVPRMLEQLRPQAEEAACAVNNARDELAGCRASIDQCESSTRYR